MSVQQKISPRTLAQLRKQFVGKPITITSSNCRPASGLCLEITFDHDHTSVDFVLNTKVRFGVGLPKFSNGICTGTYSFAETRTITLATS